jgi:ABC-type xylose transport system permease subunit
MGGNPDAAALVGIRVKRVTMLLFALLSVLVTIAAIVSIARLNRHEFAGAPGWSFVWGLPPP